MGTLRNFVESLPIEPMNVDVIRPYRNARFGAFALITWEAGHDWTAGRDRVGYALLEYSHGAWVIRFHGADFRPSPLRAIDCAQNRADLLGLLVYGESTRDDASDAQTAFLDSDRAAGLVDAFECEHGLLGE